MFRNYKKYIWLGIYVLSAIFILYYFYKYFHSITLHLSLNTIPLLLIALFINGFAWFLMASCWAYMVRVHHDIGYMKLVKSFYVSQIVRYIPGNVWSYLARFANSKKLGVSVSATGYYFSLENINLIFVSFLFSLLSISFLSAKYYLPIAFGLILITILFFMVQFNPKYFRKIMKYFEKKFKISMEYESLSRTNLIIVFLFFVTYWGLFGLSFYLILIAFGITQVSVLSAFGFNALAWLVGYLSLVTPSGLGVREVVLVGFLAKVVNSTISLAIALISRIIFTISELIGLVFVLSYENLKKWFKKFDKHLLVVIILAIIYMVYFPSISIIRVHNLYSGRYDLGDMDQAVWTTIHGNFFSMTNPAGDDFVSRLSTHADVMLILISPLYLIYSSPYTLLVLQSIIIGIGVIPLYLLARKIIKSSWISFAIAISFLLNPAIEHINFYDFHAVSFCITFFIFVIYYLYEKKYLPAFIFCLLAILTKEEIGIVVFLIGLYIIFRNKNLKEGLIFAITGISSSAFFIAFLIPHFRPNDTVHFALNFYGKYAGASPLSALISIFSDPRNLLSNVFSYQSWVYLYQLLLPVGFLSLFSPIILLLATSEFAINILSDNYNMKTIFLQYPSAIIPFVFIALIFAVNNIKRIYGEPYRKFIQKYIKLSINKLLFIFIFSFALIGGYFLGILPLEQNYASYIYYPRPDSDIVSKLSSEIPSKYSVSASNSLGSAFSERRNIYVFPIQSNTADFILVFKDEQFQIVDNAVVDRAIDYLMDSKDYSLVYNGSNLYVWQEKDVHIRLQF